MEELGYALRLARERRGLTQTQVMNLTGINNKTALPAMRTTSRSRTFRP